MRTPVSVALILLVAVFSPVHSAYAQVEQAASNRKVVNRVLPEYPRLARDLSLHGKVKLEVTVSGNGTVKSVEVKGGSPILVQSAQTAVHAWRWEKAERETTEIVEFNFNQ
jgi:TonB family protein